MTHLEGALLVVVVGILALLSTLRFSESKPEMTDKVADFLEGRKKRDSRR